MNYDYLGYCPNCYSDQISIDIKGLVQEVSTKSYSGRIYPQEDYKTPKWEYGFVFKCIKCKCDCEKLLSVEDMRDIKINNLFDDK